LLRRVIVRLPPLNRPITKLQARCLFAFSTLNLVVPFTITSSILFDRDGNSTWTWSSAVRSGKGSALHASSGAQSGSASTFFHACRARSTWPATPGCRRSSFSRPALGAQVSIERILLDYWRLL
jgi:hypothetical protein